MFRTPDFPNIFACFIGMGTQVFVSVYSMLVFTTVAFHFVNLRPYILSISLVALAIMGWINGYMTARVLKFFGSIDWCFSAMIAAVMLPSYLTITFGVIDIFEWFEGSSSWMPFSNIFGYTLCWLAICCPLCFLGSYMGF